MWLQGIVRKNSQALWFLKWSGGKPIQDQGPVRDIPTQKDQRGLESNRMSGHPQQICLPCF